MFQQGPKPAPAFSQPSPPAHTGTTTGGTTAVNITLKVNAVVEHHVNPNEFHAGVVSKLWQSVSSFNFPATAGGASTDHDDDHAAERTKALTALLERCTTVSFEHGGVLHIGHCLEVAAKLSSPSQLAELPKAFDDVLKRFKNEGARVGTGPLEG